MTHDPKWPIAPRRPSAHNSNYRMVAELEHLANLAQIDREIDDPEGEAARACTLKRCRRARACREPETCTQSAMEDVRIAQANAVKEAEEEARRAPQRRARPRQEAR